ncbi:MAG: hypothetical protein HY240_09750 [Actinobacteria bacterium]|nr:hypothetical protein [Actinomycetota bacterium]
MGTIDEESGWAAGGTKKRTWHGQPRAARGGSFRTLVIGSLVLLLVGQALAIGVAFGRVHALSADIDAFRAEQSGSPSLAGRVADLDTQVQELTSDAAGNADLQNTVLALDVEVQTLHKDLNKVQDEVAAAQFASDTTDLENRVSALEDCMNTLSFDLSQGIDFFGC